MGLTLDGEGRYVQGPTFGKAEYLVSQGAKRRRKPNAFPLGKGRQLIAVVRNPAFEAALWVQDDIDWKRVKRIDDRPVVWLEIPNEPLFTAEREPLERVLDEGAARPFDGGRAIG